jgi:hypothetical protein
LEEFPLLSWEQKGGHTIQQVPWKRLLKHSPSLDFVVSSKSHMHMLPTPWLGLDEGTMLMLMVMVS